MTALTQTLVRVFSSFRPRTHAKANRKSRVPTAKLSIAETAQYLRVSEADVMQLIHNEKLIAHVEGNQYRISMLALQYYQAQRHFELIQTGPLGVKRDAQLS